MSQQREHLRHYEALRADAYREENSDELRVEALFLAAYHLIEACAAKVGIHISKHQKVRDELEANVRIFGEETAKVWSAFQELENRVRPGFVYGASQSKAGFRKAVQLFESIETLCKEVLK